MADLVTHVALTNLLGKVSGDDRARALFIVGSCVPDVAYKGLLYLGGATTWTSEPSHSPLALAPLCMAAALLFEESWRPRAFLALLLGSWLHVLVDLGKSYMGQGVILWAFPFSMSRVELCCYHTEDMAWMWIPSLALLLLTEAVARRFGRAF